MANKAMTPDEMQKLAQKLVKMKFNRAKGHVRGMDRESFLELFRTAVTPDEWHTRYALPNKGVLVTLVEKKEYYGAPNEFGYRNSRFKYVEARVEELPPNHYKDNRGNTKVSTSAGMVGARQ